MNKQKFLDFIKSLTFGKLLRWGIKSWIFLFGALLIIFALENIYDMIQSYDEDWYWQPKDGFAKPKKYIWFIVPVDLFKIFLSCYFISDAWHRKSILYLFIMMILFFASVYIVGASDHKLLFLTTFWW